MPIPDFQTLMLPLLRLFVDGGELTSQETNDALATEFRLSSQELAQRLPSGRQSLFTNRVAWARSHLKMAGLLESPRRSVYRLSPRGRATLLEAPARVDIAYLMRFPEYAALRKSFRKPRARVDDGDSEADVEQPDTTSPDSGRTPDDLMEDGYRQHRAALAADLRERISTMSPAAFEQLVVDLLTAMGYGGPQEDSGLVVGGGGDEGVDGVIKEDRLGLETIYIQAKRWQNTVGRPDIQRFAGALQGQRARKGVFITTSTFSREARSYANAIQTTIVLVDGGELAEFMIDHDVAVTRVRTYELRRVDSDYFAAE